jgi:hypothetical protein
MGYLHILKKEIQSLINYTRWSRRLYRDGWIASIKPPQISIALVRMTKSELPYLKKCLQEMRCLFQCWPVLWKCPDMHKVIFRSCYIFNNFLHTQLLDGDWVIMHLYININKVLPSLISISGQKGFGESGYDFFNHSQELGFKVSTILDMGFHCKEWGELCNFILCRYWAFHFRRLHIIVLSFCKITLLPWSFWTYVLVLLRYCLQNFHFSCLCV